MYLPLNANINEEDIKEKYKNIEITTNDENIILKFSLNEVNLDDVLLLLINKYHIKDFRIDDISIEDITKKLYEKNDEKD